MKKRLFFLGHDGWFEAEVKGQLGYASAEELGRWACALMKHFHYRNYLITENPEYVMAGCKSLPRDAGTFCA